MTPRKLMLSGLLALAMAATLAAPNPAEAGHGRVRGVYVTVRMQWYHAQYGHYTSRMVAKYWYSAGWDTNDSRSFSYHFRNMTSQGYRFVRYDFEHYRYF